MKAGNMEVNATFFSPIEVRLMFLFFFFPIFSSMASPEEYHQVVYFATLRLIRWRSFYIERMLMC